MTGRRAIVGLSLLCALALCAVAAPSASAEGTTAFTCVKVEKGTEGFSDEHCDKAVKSGATYVHEEIKPKTATEFEITNGKTAEETKGAMPSTLTGTLAGVDLVVTCKTIKGTGTLTNEESGAMQATGSATIEHSECTVTKPTACKVKGPIVYSTKFKTYQSKSEMGIEFTPKTGGEFGGITYEGESCPFKGQTIGISGAFKGTPGGTSEGKGATLYFDDGGTLQWGPNTYDFTGAITWRMKSGGNPIVLTTT